jgi:hypothetical protein
MMLALCCDMTVAQLSLQAAAHQNGAMGNGLMLTDLPRRAVTQQAQLR